MSIDPVDFFREFYAAVHDGNKPYQWQERLLTSVVETGRWPDGIDAPTGAGKTSVIDVHVVANALAGFASLNGQAAVHDDVPRRLALVVPRRALVDDQLEVSARIADMLANGSSNSVLRDVARGLRARAGNHSSSDGHDDHSSPLVVASVRGGISVRGREVGVDEWQLAPAHAAVLHFTPDMFGSGLLFRRYGASVGRRPQEAGLLAYDTVAVFDEAHLARQLTATARRVADLEGASVTKIGRPVLQVVSTSATLGESPQPTRVGVDESDLEVDHSLRARLVANKPVEVVDLSSPIDSPRSVDDIVDRLVQLHDQHGGPVGCIVNTVKLAIRLGERLRERVTKHGDHPVGVLTLVGRMRPFDRRHLTEKQHPGVLTPKGNADIGFIVATQTVEVGVDLDFSALITELASSSAIAQRAGRVNRRGLRDASPIVVLAPRKHAGGVYSDDELETARGWLEKFTSLDPLAVSRQPPPEAGVRRTLWQRLERWDAEYLASTREDLDAQVGPFPAGIELWTRDAFDESVDVSIVVRDLPTDDGLAARVLAQTVPMTDEMFPTSIGLARRVLETHLKDGSATRRSHARVFVFDPATETFEVRRASGTAEWRLPLRPGDLVVVDSSAALFTEGVVSEEPRRAAARDVSTAVAASVGRPTIVILSGESATEGRSSASFEESTGALHLPVADVNRLAQLIQSATDEETELEIEANETTITRLRDVLGDGPWATLATVNDMESLLGDVVRQDGEDGETAVVLRLPDLLEQGELAEVRAGRGRASVLLADHQRSVGERVTHFADAMSIPEKLGESLMRAGLLHDEGKKDPRFQALLRRGRSVSPDAPPLAKSRTQSWGNERQFRARVGLTGWRHEQLSAAMAAVLESGQADRDLVVRLVGTSHGYGRSTFADDTARLIPARADLIDDILGVQPADVFAASQRLFDEGHWEALIDRTHAEFGFWGCAYLEALLRAADITVSAEGN